MNIVHRLLVPSLVALILAATLPFAAPSQRAEAQEAAFVPIIYVHGFVGSGAQYQSQAMRFASNGYPEDHVRVFDYNSLNSGPEVVQPLLDAFINDVLAELGGDQVYVLGHSLGTSVMQGYLNSSTERADRVAKYINLDGADADEPPGGVATLAIWGQGNSNEEIAGAENVYFPDQTHTQVVTSPESFAAQYEFLIGEPPARTDVEPEAGAEIAGRAVVFPENHGIEGATLDIWEVDGLTGKRLDESPIASYTLDEAGAFGPVPVAEGTPVEFVISRPTSELQHHIYMQAFTRSNYWIRLLSVEPDSPIATNIEGSPRHSTVTVIRYKEWWGDSPTGDNDTLEISGTNVINPAISPVSNRTIGIHIFDRGSDGVSDLSQPEAFFASLPFQTGADFYMPAAPPEGAICLANAPRGDTTSLQVINLPNLPGSDHRMSVEFTDYVRDGDPPCGETAVAAEPTDAPPPQLPATGDRAPDSGEAAVVAGTVALAAALAAVLATWLIRRRRFPN